MAVFITDDADAKVPLQSMPNQRRWGVNKLEAFLAPLVKKGLSSVILFGVPLKTPKMSSVDHSGSVIQAIKLLRRVFPSLYIATKVCLCEYTDHGHCGTLHEDGTINNTPSVARLAEAAVNYAKAGTHCVAPGDMMDGKVAAIKKGLLDAGLGGKVTLMAYSAKFSSGLYGPFRDAVDSALSFGD
ncbi:Aminolevulinate dehydratase [Thecaphora frezii]